MYRKEKNIYYRSSSYQDMYEHLKQYVKFSYNKVSTLNHIIVIPNPVHTDPSHNSTPATVDFPVTTTLFPPLQ